MISQVDNRAEQHRHVVVLQWSVSDLFARVAVYMEPCTGTLSDVAALLRAPNALLGSVSGLFARVAVYMETIAAPGRLIVAQLSHAAVALAGYTVLQESLAAPLPRVAVMFLRIAAQQWVVAAPLVDLIHTPGYLTQTAAWGNVAACAHINAEQPCPAPATLSNALLRPVIKPAASPNAQMMSFNVSAIPGTSAAKTRKQQTTSGNK